MTTSEKFYYEYLVLSYEKKSKSVLKIKISAQS